MARPPKEIPIHRPPLPQCSCGPALGADRAAATPGQTGSRPQLGAVAACRLLSRRSIQFWKCPHAPRHPTPEPDADGALEPANLASAVEDLRKGAATRNRVSGLAYSRLLPHVSSI